MKKNILFVAGVLLSLGSFAQTTWTNDKMHSKIGLPLLI